MAQIVGMGANQENIPLFFVFSNIYVFLFYSTPLYFAQCWETTREIGFGITNSFKVINMNMNMNGIFIHACMNVSYAYAYIYIYISDCVQATDLVYANQM